MTVQSTSLLLELTMNPINLFLSMKAPLTDESHAVHMLGHQREVMQEGVIFLFVENGARLVKQSVHTQLICSVQILHPTCFITGWDTSARSFGSFFYCSHLQQIY
jgi:hypothetical protein